MFNAPDEVSQKYILLTAPQNTRQPAQKGIIKPKVYLGVVTGTSPRNGFPGLAQLIQQ